MLSRLKRVIVSADEDYPVFTIEPAGAGEDDAVELPARLVRRFARAERRYAALTYEVARRTGWEDWFEPE